MYQALYRKWRPQTFDDVIGQKQITDSLKNQVKTGHLSHAYIFIGTRGTGKTTCARILAKAVNCEHPVDGNPCGECPSCRGIADGSIMDIVELDAASNNGVDNVRALRDEAIFSPASVKKRVYIIDEVHMLSASAFNALLKILEEPPEHLMFILATTELQKVPATILSRCQRHSFKRIDNRMLAEYLMHIAQNEGISLTDEAAGLISGLAEGSARDALSMLDQCSSLGVEIGEDEVYSAVGLAGNKRTLSLFEKLVNHDTEAALTDFDGLWKDGKDPSVILKELSSLARDVLMLKVAPKNASGLIYGGYDRKTLNRFAESMTVEELSCAVETLQSAMSSMRDRLNTRMTAELCLISLSNSLLGNSLENIRARISTLESVVNGGRPINSQAVSESKSEAPIIQRQTVTQESVVYSGPAIMNSEPETVELSPQQAEKPCIDDAWKTVCERLKPALSHELSAYLADSSIVNGTLKENVLTVSVKNPFYLSRLNRDEFIEPLKKHVAALIGKEPTVRFSEMKQETEPEQKNTGNLDELKKFKEVSFI